MKKALFLLGLALSAWTLGAQPLDRSVRPQPAAPRTPSIAAYEKMTLKNGLTVVVVENHKLPRMSVSLSLDMNGVREGDKAGYVELLGQMLSEGTTTRTKTQLDEQVDFVGARLNTSAFNVSVSGLSKYSANLYELVADVALHPAFPEAAFDKLKKRTLSGLKADKDDPSAIQARVSNALLYGTNTPQGEMMTEATVNKVALDDCKSFYSQVWVPNHAVLLVVGDCKAKDVFKAAKKTFEKSWPAGTVPAKPTYEHPVQTKSFIALVNREASVQSNIQLANLIDLKPGDADLEAVRVMNNILGGGSDGRLFQNLREDKAYTYGAYSSFGTGKEKQLFEASGEVRNAVTDSSVEQFLLELNRIRTELVNETDLRNAKQALAGSFGRSLEGPGAVASFAINTLKYNLSADYYNQYLNRLQAVTAEDVRRAAQKYIQPDKMVVSIVGKASEVAAGLERLGEVRYFDDFAQPAERPNIPIPAGVTAVSVVNQYLAAIGGQKAIASVKDLTLERAAEIQGIKIETKDVYKLPNMHYEGQFSPMGKEETFFDGKKGRIVRNGTKQPVTDEDLDAMRQDANYFEELKWMTSAVPMQLAPVYSSIAGEPCYAVTVTQGKQVQTHYFSVKSGLRVATSTTVGEGEQATVQTVNYSDYRAVGGVLFPHSVVLPIGPGMNLEFKAVNLTVNTNVADSFFK
ncbi:MAG: insulinase family protein [Schleiferiaceae bacterium]|jgi:zinc protease|nr:insulinase family protein [Schleiferiaceae bacterium]MDP4627526.1 insulinase family protein [Schleiferiaceae bacterium]MDP4728395.1 insulinase family protein [Schleiferiaceae bacterium]MDP4749118.1 insulinase family protein [Schleiferiaceae bacterium]MDP4859281.1 insulinase family protein [Schleiferiaceae bacterium]